MIFLPIIPKPLCAGKTRLPRFESNESSNIKYKNVWESVFLSPDRRPPTATWFFPGTFAARNRARSSRSNARNPSKNNNQHTPVDPTRSRPKGSIVSLHHHHHYHNLEDQSILSHIVWHPSSTIDCYKVKHVFVQGFGE